MMISHQDEALARSHQPVPRGTVVTTGTWDVAENVGKRRERQPSASEGFSLAGKAASAVAIPAHDFCFRVLLALPDARTIPIFALGVEAGRYQIETKLVESREALSRLLGGNISRAIPGRYGEHRLINVRRRIGERTAIYSFWLTFPELTRAEAFVRDHARFGLTAIEAWSETQFRSREEKFKAAAARGRYDLSRLDPRQGKWRAREYFTEAEALDKLEWGQLALVRLKESLASNPDGVSVG